MEYIYYQIEHYLIFCTLGDADRILHTRGCGQNFAHSVMRTEFCALGVRTIKKPGLAGGRVSAAGQEHFLSRDCFIPRYNP